MKVTAAQYGDDGKAVVVMTDAAGAAVIDLHTGGRNAPDVAVALAEWIAAGNEPAMAPGSVAPKGADKSIVLQARLANADEVQDATPTVEHHAIGRGWTLTISGWSTRRRIRTGEQDVYRDEPVTEEQETTRTELRPEGDHVVAVETKERALVPVIDMLPVVDQNGAAVIDHATGRPMMARVPRTKRVRVGAEPIFEVFDAQEWPAIPDGLRRKLKASGRP